MLDTFASVGAKRFGIMLTDAGGRNLLIRAGMIKGGKLER
jgi:hypothetical protein